MKGFCRPTLIALLLVLSLPVLADLTSTTPDSSGTFTLSWSPPPRGYIDLSESINAGSYNKIYSTSGSFRTLTRSPGTYNYQLEVYSCSFSCSRTGSSYVTVTIGGSPGIPGYVASSDGVKSYDGNYKISWGTSSGHVSYYRWRENSGSWHNTGTTRYVSRTRNNGTYSYDVQACNSKGCSSSQSITVTVDKNISPTISRSVGTSNSGSYSLSWTKGRINGKVGEAVWVYENGTPALVYGRNHEGTLVENQNPLARSKSSDGTWTYYTRSCINTGYISQGSYQGTEPDPNTGTCTNSTSTTVKVRLVPGMSSSLTSSDGADSYDGSYTISWGSGSGTVTHYQWRENSGGWNGTGTSLTTPTLTRSDGTYAYDVRACNSVGCSEIRGLEVTVNKDISPTVGSSTATSTSGSYSLSWTRGKISGKAGEAVWIYENDTPILVYGTNHQGTVIENQNPLSRTKGGDGSWTYYIRSCINTGYISPGSYQGSQPNPDGGTCKNSSPTTVAVDIAVPSQVGGVIVHNVDGQARTRMSWRSVSHATRYEIRYGRRSTAPESRPVSTALSSTEHFFSNLPEDTWEFEVRGCNGDTCGLYSEPAEKAVRYITLEASTTLSEDGTATLSWNAAPTIVPNLSYRIFRNGVHYRSTALRSLYYELDLVDGTYEFSVKGCVDGTNSCPYESNPVAIAVAVRDSEGGVPGDGSSDGGDYSGAPTAPATIVGSTAGKFRVNESGAAIYEIPLSVPEGTAGVTPQLSLNYSSQGDNGLLGQGWNLGGLSAISRCRQTLSQDGAAKPITWSEKDRFCLDGGRLVVEGHATYGSVGATYKTAIDSFVTVTSYGGTLGHPAYFVVKRRDGSRAYYGNTEDSRHSLGSSGQVMSWFQNKFEDSLHVGGEGNRIEFSYYHDGQGPRVKQIRYGFGTGSMPSATVDFAYQDRPDVIRGYLGGQLLVTARRLRQITVNNMNAEVRRYVLRYQPTPDDGLYRNTSKLSTLQECVETNCLPVTRFDWADEAVGFSSTYSGTISRPSGYGDSYLKYYKPADINGDGNLDLILLALDEGVDGVYHRVTVAFSDGERISSRDLVVEYKGKSLSPTSVTPLDYNADGRQDLAFYNPDDAVWRVYLSKPDAEGGWKIDKTDPITTPVTDSNASFVDINGDGLLDAVSANRYWLLEPRGTQAVDTDRFYRFEEAKPFNWSGLDPLAYPTGPEGCIHKQTYKVVPTHAVDFDGNGTADFIGVHERGLDCSSIPGVVPVMANQAVYAMVSDNGQLSKYASLSVDRHYNPRSVQLMDINGDGLSDIFYKAGGLYYYLINNGAGFNSPVEFGALSEFKPAAMDYNGDGAADIYWNDTSVGELRVRLWAGSEFSVVKAVRTDTSFRDKDSHIFTDMNGDGRVDYVHDSITFIRTYLGHSLPPGQAPNSIVGIDNSLGHYTEVSYGTLGRSGHYTRMDVNPDITTDTGTIFPACPDSGRCTPYDWIYHHVDTSDFYRRLNSGWNLPEGSHALGDNLTKDYPTLEVTGAMYVVTGTASTAPQAGSAPGSINEDALRRTSYYYGEAKLQASGRGFLGFHKLKMVDEQSGITTTTTYRQDYPLVGRPLSTLVQSSSGMLLSQAHNTWAFNVVNGKRYQPYLAQSIEHSYDLGSDGTVQGEWLKTVTTETIPDNDGNADSITIVTEGPNEKITKIVDNDFGNTDQLRLGRLQSSTVTVTSPGKEPRVRKSEFTYHQSGTKQGLLQFEIAAVGTDVALTTEHLYDAFGNEIGTSQTAADGSTRQSDLLNFDEHGRYVDTVTNALGHVTSDVLERSKFGSPIRISNINGVVTEIAYDAFGREYSRQDATGAWSWRGRSLCDGSVGCPASAEYRIENRVAGGGKSFTYVDALGRTVREITIGFDGTPIHVDTEYDEAGRPKRVSNPYFEGSSPDGWTETTYDLLGRSTGIMLPDGTSGGTTTYEGYSATVTNALNHTKTEVRDVQGQLVHVTDSLGGTVAYTYDFDGNLLSATTDAPDTNPVTVRMCYDSLGRKIAMHDPDKGGFLGNASAGCDTVTKNLAGWWTYQYNGLGELTSQTDTKGQTRSLTYDDLGRMLTRTDYRSGTVETHTRWYYDASVGGTSLPGDLGNVTYVVQSENAVNEQCDSATYCETYIYDEYGRQTDKIVLHAGAETGYMTGIRYDSIGRPYRQYDVLQSLVMADSGTRQYYNAYGYKESVVDLATGDVLHQILETDARGQVTLEERANGVMTTEYSYDPYFGRLESKRTASLGLVFPIQDLTYHWDALGNLEYRENQSATENNESQNNLQENFCYDGLNRLIKTHHGTTGGNCGAVEQDVEYDGQGNIKSKGGVGYLYGSNAGPHAVTSAGGVIYTYDHNGNMVSGDGRTLTYSTFDKPVEIGKGGHTTAFKYGPDRSRYQRVDETSNGVVTTTLYLGSIERTHEEGSETITWQRTVADAVYIVKTDLNHNIQGSTEKAFVFKDHLGSTDVVASSIGTVVQSQSFDAWGQRRKAETGELLSSAELVGFNTRITQRGYSGHEQMDELGLIHMNGRVYDPKLGRFLQADPLIQAASNTQSYNRYSYVWNNPLNATDPSGFSLSSLWNEIRPFVGAIVAVALCVAASCAGSAEAMFWIGGVSGAAGAAANGGGIGDVITGGLLGAFSGAAAGVGAGMAGQLGGFVGAGLGGALSANVLGGSMGQGFITAGVGGLFGAIEGVRGFAVAATAGGVISEITGGKFKNGAATAAFMWALRAGMARANSSNDAEHTDNPYTKNGRSPHGRNDFKDEALVDIDNRMEAVKEEMLNTNHGDFKSTAAALSQHEGLTSISDTYGIEVGAVISPTGTILEIGTDYHHSKLRSFLPDVGSGQHSWHTHPGRTFKSDLIGRRVDLRIPSGGDMDVAQGAGGWNFVRYSDGTFGGVNGNTGVIYMYEGGSWNPTGDRY